MKEINYMRYYELIARFGFDGGRADVRAGANIKAPFNNWLEPTPWTEPVPKPLQLEIRENGDMLPFYKHPFPIMKKSLLKAIRDAGVDNIDDYAVEINNPFDGTINTDYRAMNVIGAIKAIDEVKSLGELLDESGSKLAGKFYDKIILDEDKTNGKLLFRLEEKLSYIVVAESIKELIEEQEDPSYFIFAPLFEVEVEDDDDDDEFDDYDAEFYAMLDKKMAEKS